jgi:hypothetical protein
MPYALPDVFVGYQQQKENTASYKTQTEPCVAFFHMHAMQHCYSRSQAIFTLLQWLPHYFHIVTVGPTLLSHCYSRAHATFTMLVGPTLLSHYYSGSHTTFTLLQWVPHFHIITVGPTLPHCYSGPHTTFTLLQWAPRYFHIVTVGPMLLSLLQWVPSYFHPPLMWRWSETAWDNKPKHSTTIWSHYKLFSKTTYQPHQTNVFWIIIVSDF